MLIIMRNKAYGAYVAVRNDALRVNIERLSSRRPRQLVPDLRALERSVMGTASSRC